MEYKPIIKSVGEKLEYGDCFLCHRPNVPIDIRFQNKEVCCECAEFMVIMSMMAMEVAKEGKRREDMKFMHGVEVG